jgi:hypothetical protein
MAVHPRNARSLSIERESGGLRRQGGIAYDRRPPTSGSP